MHGVICMANRIALIIGAGFSVPASLPMQNEILREMSRSPTNSILELESEMESIKFLHAYIEVATYLLIKYSGPQYKLLQDEYALLMRQPSKDVVISELIKELSENSDDTYIAKDSIHQLENFILGSAKLYSELVIFKERIRKFLEKENISISLEDVFTSFDKSFASREYLKDYSYGRLDQIRQSIMRLFTYYFGMKIHKHSFEQGDYVAFVEFVKKHTKGINLITTNWDTLIEHYFKKHGIIYDLALNDLYYQYDDNRKNPNKKAVTKVIKLHGSINWFHCLDCGTLSIIEKPENSNYLFDDSSEEICISCKRKAASNELLLQPEIITPSMIKSIDHQLYKNLWKAARTELMNADKVVFVGYSFPVADYEFGHLLQKSISSDAEIDVVLYKTDDPGRVSDTNDYLRSLLPEKRYRDAFHQNKINFFYNGFREYFEKM